MASEKQIAVLKKAGYSTDKILAMSPQEVSDAIGKIFSEKESKPVQTQAGVSVEGQLIQTQIQIVRNERPNSYEYGKAGDRFKIYFSDVNDLQEQIDALANLRLPIADIPTETY